MNRIIIYIDGSSKLHLPNKPGTCAYVVVSKQEVIHSKAFRYYNTTNNRMEIEGLSQALLYVKNNISPTVQVEIYTDSEYVRKGISEWVKKWKSNGWKTANKSPVLNQDLWEKLDDLYTKMENVHINWCKGHAGNKFNEEADRLCTEAYKKTVKEPEKVIEKKSEITAKKFLLDRLWPKTSEEYREAFWISNLNSVQQIVEIMEKYKQL